MKASIDALLRIAEDIEDCDDNELLFRSIIKGARSACHAEWSVISYYDTLTGEIYYRRICGFRNRDSDLHNELFTRNKSNDSVLAWIAKTGKCLNISPKNRHHYLPMLQQEQLGINIHSLLAVPVLYHQKLFGVIAVINKKTGEYFSGYDLKLLKIIASVSALLLETTKLHEEIDSSEHLSDLGKNIANSAHGLKNILNNIDGGTFIVQSGVKKKRMETVTEGWDIMKRNTSRLRELVLDMLLFARPSKPTYKPSDINKICTDLIDLIRDTAKKEHIEVKTQLDPTIGLCCFDSKGIYRCILNLTYNAIQACSGGQGNSVILQTKYIGNEEIEVKVTDNGSGISDQNINHIFEVFFTTKKSKGTGLGLAVTKKIIEEHNGSITVQSRLNEGSTFTIRLPKIHKKHCL